MSVYINGVELVTHAALTTGVHGVGSSYLPKFDQEGQKVSKVIWKDSPQTALNDDNRTSTLTFTDLDLSGYTSLYAKFAIVRMDLKADTVGTGNDCDLKIRKNGTTPAHYPRLILDKAGTTAGVSKYMVAIIGLDDGQVIEYAIDVGTNWQVDSDIKVLGYIE